jgi:hypothetical protein
MSAGHRPTEFSPSHFSRPQTPVCYQQVRSASYNAEELPPDTHMKTAMGQQTFLPELAVIYPSFPQN